VANLVHMLKSTPATPIPQHDYFLGEDEFRYDDPWYDDPISESAASDPWSEDDWYGGDADDIYHDLGELDLPYAFDESARSDFDDFPYFEAAELRYELSHCIHGNLLDAGCYGCDLDDYYGPLDEVSTELPFFDLESARRHEARKCRKGRQRQAAIRSHRRRLVRALHSRHPSTEATSYRLSLREVVSVTTVFPDWQLHGRKVQEPRSRYSLTTREYREMQWLKVELNLAGDDLA
jgi:hypothetical protein